MVKFDPLGYSKYLQTNAAQFRYLDMTVTLPGLLL